MSSYWERRAELDMKVAQDSADKILERIQDYHKDAAAEISDMATRIRKRFAASYGLSDDDADKMLAQPCGREEYMQLLNQISRLGKNNPRRRYLMAKAAAPSYSYRISLQESMRDQLSAITSRITEREEKGIRGHLMDVVDDQSKRTAFNLAKQSGIGFQFGGISEKLASRIISTPWSGRSFSARVWTNQARLEELLNRELRNGILNGASIDKTSQIIAEAMDVSMHRARCLVRTETTYAANQADLQTYNELGISSYRYVAMLDSRTSEICRKLDGQIFKVSEAQAGKNFPPMHPYCRSRTISNLEDQDLDKMKRIARDPETGEYEKVPATMTYKEWENKFSAIESSIFTKQSGGKLEDGSKTKPTKGWQVDHAVRFYREVSRRAEYADARKISSNVPEFSVDQVEEIRKHVFIRTHKFEDESEHKFFPSYQEALAWQRLIDGNYTDLDVLFLNHELKELTLISEFGYNQTMAHIVASKEFPWWPECRKKGMRDYVSDFPAD